MVQVLALVPTAPSRALPLVVGRLPHKTRDTNAHCVALRAAFAVAGSPAGATIRDEVLAAVVDKLLELDVEIAWQDISERPGAGHARAFDCATSRPPWRHELCAGHRVISTCRAVLHPHCNLQD